MIKEYLVTKDWDLTKIVGKVIIDEDLLGDDSVLAIAYVPKFNNKKADIIHFNLSNDGEYKKYLDKSAIL